MNGIINTEEARALNNASPANQVYQLGDALRISQDVRSVRQLDYVRYVDANVTFSGDGKSWEDAFKTIKEGFTALNELSGYGATLMIAPGFYIEKASEVPTLTGYDFLIKAVGLPEDTVLLGSGSNGAIATANDDLIKITGGNIIIEGLGLYVHKNDKACIKFDDTGAGYHGSFNIIRGCYFSPQAQDGVGYGIKYAGGNVNIIEDNIFYGDAVAGILVTGNVGNPVRNIIRRNQFVGTTIGISITSANYNTLVADNWFSAGSQAGEDMTNAIVISAGMNAGKLSVIHNYFEQSDVNDIADSKTGGTLVEIDNSNAA